MGHTQKLLRDMGLNYSRKKTLPKTLQKLNVSKPFIMTYINQCEGERKLEYFKS